MSDRLTPAHIAAEQEDWSLLIQQLQVLAAEPDPVDLDTMLWLAMQALEQGDFQTRWDVAKLLPRLGDRAIPALLGILQDPDLDIDEEWELLWFAARSLGEFEHPEAIAALINLLQTAENEDMVRIAATALANRGAGVIASLNPLLTADATRLAAVQVLAQIDDSAVLEPLLQQVTDRSPDVRSAAIAALVRFRDRRVAEALIAALSDPVAQIRQTAVSGLGLQADLLRDRDLVALVQPLLSDLHLNVSCQAAVALSRLRSPMSALALWETLRSPNTPALLKVEAVRALSWMEIPEALDYLQQFLALTLTATDFSGAPDRQVCQEIVAVLGRLQSPALRATAAQILMHSLSTPSPIAHDPQLRQTLAFSLGQLDQPQAIDALIQLLADSDAGVRLHAIAALKQLSAQHTHDRLIQAAAAPNLPTNLEQGIAIALSEWESA